MIDFTERYIQEQYLNHVSFLLSGAAVSNGGVCVGLVGINQLCASQLSELTFSFVLIQLAIKIINKYMGHKCPLMQP